MGAVDAVLDAEAGLDANVGADLAPETESVECLRKGLKSVKSVLGSEIGVVIDVDEEEDNLKGKQCS